MLDDDDSLLDDYPVNPDPKAGWPTLTRGESIGIPELADALDVTSPLISARMYARAYDTIRFAWLRAVSAWRHWHLHTHRIAIRPDKKTRSYRALYVGEQLALADEIRDALRARSVRVPAELIRYCTPTSPSEQEQLIQSKRVQQMYAASTRNKSA